MLKTSRSGGGNLPQRRRELNNPPIPLKIPWWSAKKASQATRLRERKRAEHLITVPEVIICRKIRITASSFSTLSKSLRSKFSFVCNYARARERERNSFAIFFLNLIINRASQKKSRVSKIIIDACLYFTYHRRIVFLY